jgi:hypothetical protein
MEVCFSIRSLDIEVGGFKKALFRIVMSVCVLSVAVLVQSLLSFMFAPSMIIYMKQNEGTAYAM